MNEDLRRISDFLKMMKLKLNVNKTKAMMINKRQSTTYDIVIDGEPIELVKSMKYLGVIIDDRLTFNSNIEYIANKINKKISLLYRIRKKIDRDLRLTFFKTTVPPHFDYCSSILFLANENQFNQLQLLMNRALRIIENADRLTNIHTMLESTDLLDVKQRVYYNVMMLIYRAQNQLLPENLCNQFKLIGHSQPYTLRNNEQLRPPPYTTATSQNSFMYKGAQLYNSFVQRTAVSARNSENEYRKAVKAYIKANVSSHRIPSN